MAVDSSAWLAEPLIAEGEGPNQAPVINANAVVSLPTITENDNFPSAGWRGVFMIATLLQDAGYSDVDANSNSLFASGIAITGFTGRGYLAYATELNGAWTRVPAVSETSALLLALNFYDSSGFLYPQWISYVPDGANGEQVSFTFRAWDLTSGTPSNRTPTSRTGVPSFGDASVNGGSTAYSANTATAQLTVTSVNDAPVINAAAQVAFPRTTENLPSASVLVSSLLTSIGSRDADIGASSGIAIVGTTGSGRWQYSTDGLVWNSIVGVNATSALLLNSASSVRYQPDLIRGERANISIKAWDQTIGVASTGAVASYGDTSVAGLATAFSANTAAGVIDVTNVNDAPTLVSGAIVRLPSTSEDNWSQPRTVDSILLSSGWNDVDAGAQKGIAVISMSGLGYWQYSTDGVAWADMETVSATSALLLSGSSRVRYEPNGWNGEIARFNFRAWDMTTGTPSTNTARSYARPITGASGAYSINYALATVQVSSFNDAPTLAFTILGIRDTNEDTPSDIVTGDYLLDQGRWNDVDKGAVKGLAITEAIGAGSWQYSMDGTNWVNVGRINASSVLLLNPSAQIRFMPDQMNGSRAEIRYRAWDQTTGFASSATTPSYGNALITGGGTAYSANDVLVLLNVQEVNDAPQIPNGAPVTVRYSQFDSVTPPVTVGSLLSAAGYSDVDRNSQSGIAIVGKSLTGTWQYSVDGVNWVTVFNFTPTSALLLTSTTQLRCWLNLLGGGTPTLSFKAWDRTAGTESTGNLPSFGDTSLSGGNSSYSLGTALVSAIMS